MIMDQIIRIICDYAPSIVINFLPCSYNLPIMYIQVCFEYNTNTIQLFLLEKKFFPVVDQVLVIYEI